MVKIGEEHCGCRYWGYEPACGELRHAIGKFGRERVHELREQYKGECATLKAAGYKPAVMGLTKTEALAKAEAIENRFDIAMWIFNHDYL